jgi:hypothetical protein
MPKGARPSRAKDLLNLGTVGTLTTSSCNIDIFVGQNIDKLLRSHKRADDHMNGSSYNVNQPP